MPALILLPKKIDISRLVGFACPEEGCLLIEHPKELEKLRYFLQEEGYYWPANANLNEDIPVFSEEKTTAVKRTMEIHVANQRRCKKTYKHSKMLIIKKIPKISIRM